MKLIILLACIALSLAETNSGQDAPQKTLAKTTLNAIPVSPKQEVQFYQPHTPQNTHQYIPVHFIPKQIFTNHQGHQPMMLIIAQPAYVPQQMLYTNAMQHLLNYFHNNPQARYQLLHNYQPHPTQQTFVAPNPAISASVPTYQYVASPQQAQGTHNMAQTAVYATQQVPQVQQYQQNHVQYVQPQYTATSQGSTANNVGTTAFASYGAYNQNVQPLSLSHISNLAHSTAQNFVKTAPPIITGLEQFTPEQQAQIKSQLNSHLGTGTPITPISSNHITVPTKSTQTEESTLQYGAKLIQQTNSHINSQNYIQPTSQPYAHVTHIHPTQQSVHQQPTYHTSSIPQHQTQSYQQPQQQYGQQEEKQDSKESSSDFQPSVGYRTYTKV